MLPDIRKGTVAEPIAQNTQLGWIVFGPAEAAQTTSISIEDHFQQTHIRQPNGKYLVRLPLKTLFDPTHG